MSLTAGELGKVEDFVRAVEIRAREKDAKRFKAEVLIRRAMADELARLREEAGGGRAKRK
jgi:hypothetical protein